MCFLKKKGNSRGPPHNLPISHFHPNPNEDLLRTGFLRQENPGLEYLLPKDNLRGGNGLVFEVKDLNVWDFLIFVILGGKEVTVYRSLRFR